MLLQHRPSLAPPQRKETVTHIAIYHLYPKTQAAWKSRSMMTPIITKITTMMTTKSAQPFTSNHQRKLQGLKRKLKADADEPSHWTTIRNKRLN